VLKSRRSCIESKQNDGNDGEKHAKHLVIGEAFAKIQQAAECDKYIAKQVPRQVQDGHAGEGETLEENPRL